MVELFINSRYHEWSTNFLGVEGKINLVQELGGRVRQTFPLIGKQAANKQKNPPVLIQF